MKKFASGFAAGFLLAPAVLATLGFLGRLPIAATSMPSAWESWLANRAVNASLDRTAPLHGPNSVSDSSLLSGMRIYRDNCAGCHGEFGRPSSWGTSAFYPRVPQFAEQPSPLSAPEMFVAVKHGIRYSGMGAWNGLLSDDEIWRVVTFVSRIHSLPPSVATAWKARPQPLSQ